MHYVTVLLATLLDRAAPDGGGNRAGLRPRRW